jgi:hypothetical protein
MAAKQKKQSANARQPTVLNRINEFPLVVNPNDKRINELTKKNEPRFDEEDAGNDKNQPRVRQSGPT